MDIIGLNPGSNPVLS